ncbi:hypothetical protein [Streptomyces sp. NPDC048106]|uniref:hypothetical protein n=1 Tax=Streptomyces sp. NPDC048106 TaxID=3155750 RepID=UPI0034528488
MTVKVRPGWPGCPPKPEHGEPEHDKGCARGREAGENHSTPDIASAMIDVMFRYAFHLAASAVADAPKAAVPTLAAAVDGARS